MATTKTYTRWRSETFDWICCNEELIRSCAEEMSVPVEAVAGVMAKEYNSSLLSGLLPCNTGHLREPLGYCLRPHLLPIGDFQGLAAKS